MNYKTLKKTLTSGAAVFGILAGSGFLASQAQAAVITNGCAATNQFCTLGELFDGGTIQVGDKVFTHWQEVGLSPVIPADIQVSGIFQDTNAPGVKFTALNNALTVRDGNDLEFTFDFKVTSLGEKIKDNTLKLTDHSQDGLGIINITELVGTTQGGSDLANKFVQVDGSGTQRLYDSAEFEPQQMVWVRKQISLDTSFLGDEGDEAGINMFEQRFSQVPEPTSVLSLLALGTLGAVSTLKRKLKPSQSTEKETTKVS